MIALQLNLNNYNSRSVNLFINEIKKLYQSYGYNNVKIEYSKKEFEDTNTVNLYFDINEGEITKINSIILNGNKNILDSEIKEIIKSKTKSLRNIFANNNFKPDLIERDKYLIIDFYKNNGFVNIVVETQIEYLKSNRVNVYFNITEGDMFALSSINIIDSENLLNSDILKLIDYDKNIFLQEQDFFSLDNIQQFKEEISSIIINNGIEFFEIKTLEKIEDKNVNILFQITSVNPRYTNQINIMGNSRTFDYVIRELDIIEGDAIYKDH